jgi:organic radical activating enzyme
MIKRLALEHAVVDHCNLACLGCDHASPHMRTRFSDVKEFWRDLSLLSKVMHVETFKLTGGEPLLHPQIYEFASLALSSRIADRIALWTNGLLLQRIESRLLDVLDEIHITRYPGIDLFIDKGWLYEKRQKYTIQFVDEYRSEFISPFMIKPSSDEAQIAETFMTCKNAHIWSCHSFQDGRYYKCSRASLLHKTRFFDNVNADGIEISGSQEFGDQLRDYLQSTLPLGACSFCLGTSGGTFPHRQLTKREKAEARAPSQVDRLRPSDAAVPA